MNDLVSFDFQGQNVRTLVIDGEPWWVAADVSGLLGYRMASDMTRRLEDDEKDTRLIHTHGGEQSMTIVNESGLYAAILRSDKPEAHTFKRWITHEVLPAIRKIIAQEKAGK
ncbi:MAG: hypothetical protein AMQ22_02278 [Candidatus Methanofastidiosum methylothiophilum]|uniref:Bro-N domain-containing protein n=1 Tax=Candidatus Methanofastidiosum methylothiophilum TaxID=1705564 RepID=A0A150II51_9EURY|nr:MAG: hypothetical protein AMQ22_02278 [Candidatus Methanofastidiosum methylthiophilus]